MKTPDYVTIEDYTYVDLEDGWKEKDIPAGTFVRPIAPQWLPKHILNSNGYRFFKPETETYVYMSRGIVIIPKKLMRRV